MAAISRADIRLAGSHAGVSIGEDGPSQMALEDIASMRAIHSSTVLHPSDANQASKLIGAMAEQKGIVVPAHPARQDARPHRRPTRTSGSAAAASTRRRRRRRDRRLRHHASTRPSRRPRRSRARASRPACSTATRSSRSTSRRVRAAARDCGTLVTVEDHWPEGGLGDAVLEALADADDRAEGRQARRPRDAGLRLAGGAAARGGHRRGGDRRRRAQVVGARA